MKRTGGDVHHVPHGRKDRRFSVPVEALRVDFHIHEFSVPGPVHRLDEGLAFFEDGAGARRHPLFGVRDGEIVGGHPHQFVPGVTVTPAGRVIDFHEQNGPGVPSCPGWWTKDASFRLLKKSRYRVS